MVESLKDFSCGTMMRAWQPVKRHTNIWLYKGRILFWMELNMPWIHTHCYIPLFSFLLSTQCENLMANYLAFSLSKWTPWNDVEEANALMTCYSKVLSGIVCMYYRGVLKLCPTQMQIVSLSNCAGCHFSTDNDNPVLAITLTPWNTLSGLFLTMILHNSLLDFIAWVRRLIL